MHLHAPCLWNQLTNHAMSSHKWLSCLLLVTDRARSWYSHPGGIIFSMQIRWGHSWDYPRHSLPFPQVRRVCSVLLPTALVGSFYSSIPYRFIKELDGGLLERSQLGLGHSYSRAKVRKEALCEMYICDDVLRLPDDEKLLSSLWESLRTDDNNLHFDLRVTRTHISSLSHSSSYWDASAC